HCDTLLHMVAMPIPGLPIDDLREHKVCQIAFVVNDIEKAALHWVTVFGAGPFFVSDPVTGVEAAGPDGEPAIFDHGFALGQWGTVQVELVRVYHASPAVAGAMEPGFNHVAYFAADTRAERERLAASGAPLLLATRFGGMESSLHDARATAGFVIEHYP